jgi:hypothetical protein
MKKYLILILSVMLIVSCNRRPTVTPSKADMLRSGHWTIASGTIRLKLPNGNDTLINYLNFLPLCHHDDYMVFHAGVNAAMFSGGNKCSPADPDSVSFQWNFSDNNNAISFYNGFDFTYSLTESILPFVFDTTQLNPYVIVDTLHGVFDTTLGYTRSLVILDTIWNLHFDSTYLNYNYINNAAVTNFSDNSFTINYWVVSRYPDSTNHHTNMFIDNTTTPPDTIDYNPIMRPDTFFYTITYQKS